LEEEDEEESVLQWKQQTITQDGVDFIVTSHNNIAYYGKGHAKEGVVCGTFKEGMVVFEDVIGHSSDDEESDDETEEESDDTSTEAHSRMIGGYESD